MTIDPASFRPADVMAVYGTDVRCLQTARPSLPEQPVERHHILGRAGERSTMSSILNCAPLRWDIHRGPLRDAYDQRRVYLRVALTHVMNAVGQGAYELSSADWCFIALVRSKFPEYADLYEHLD